MTGFFRRNGIFALIEIGGRLPLLFTLGYLASSVGPAVYGDWALVLATVGVLTGLGGLGLSSSISRMASGAAPHEARGYVVYALRTTAALLIVVGLVLVVARQPLGRALGVEPESRDLLAAGGIVAITGTIEALLDAYFKARERLRRQAVLVLGRTCLEVAVVAVVFGTHVFASASPQSRIALYVGLVFAAKLLLLYPIVFFARESHTSPDREMRSTLVRYGLPMVPAALVMWLTTQGDRLVLGHAVDSHELGWYAFGAALAANFSYLGLAIYPLLLPRASVMHDRGAHAEVAELFEAAQRVYLALFGALAVALALLAPDVIRVTAGERFAPSAPILLLLALAVGLEGLLGIFQWVFHLIRRTSLVLTTNLIYMALQVAAVFTVATVTHDILAVAWAVLAVVVSANAIRYVYARRLYVIRASRAMLVSLLGLAGLVAVAAEVMQDWPLGVRVALATIAGVTGIAGAVWTAGLGAHSERLLALAPKAVRS
jgi:O-antigen/teichoic acid export membrane protein